MDSSIVFHETPIPKWTLSFPKGQESWINASSSGGHSTHHDLVQPYLSLMEDSVFTPPELLTAPECYSMPPWLCSCHVFYQNILSQLLCFEDVLRLSVEINQLILCPAWVRWSSSSLYLPLPQDSFCWIVTTPFLIFSTLEYKLLKSRDWIFRSPLPSIVHSMLKQMIMEWVNELITMHTFPWNGDRRSPLILLPKEFYFHPVNWSSPRGGLLTTLSLLPPRREVYT